MIPPLDLEKLGRVAASEKDAEQLLGLFFQDAQEKLDKIKQSIQANKSDEVRQLSHSVLGASRMLGMTALGQVLEDLEKAGQQKNLKIAPDLLAQAHQEIKRTQEFLDTRTSSKRKRNA